MSFQIVWIWIVRTVILRQTALIGFNAPFLHIWNIAKKVDNTYSASVHLIWKMRLARDWSYPVVIIGDGGVW